MTLDWRNAPVMGRWPPKYEKCYSCHWYGGLSNSITNGPKVCLYCYHNDCRKNAGEEDCYSYMPKRGKKRRQYAND